MMTTVRSLILVAALLVADIGNAQTGLVVSAGAGQLTLTWQDNSDAETEFQVERSLSGDVCEFVPIAATPADAVSFTDSPLADGVRWCYRVRAANSAGVSAYSNVACATTAATGSGGTSATISFTRQVSGMAIFSVPVGPYACLREVGGTSQLRITRDGLVLKTFNLANPPVGSTFVITCEVTPTAMIFTLDRVVKLTTAP